MKNAPVPLEEFRSQLLQLRDRFGNVAVYYTHKSAPELRPVYQSIANLMAEAANLMEIAGTLTDDQERRRARVRQSVGFDQDEWGEDDEEGALSAQEREVMA